MTTGWVEVFGTCGVGKTTLMHGLGRVRVAPCECDLEELTAAVDEELARWDGSQPIDKRLRMLRSTLHSLPGTDMLIEDGPLAWVGSLAARGGRDIVDRLLVVFPPFRVLYLTASREAILERLNERGAAGGTAQQHLDSVDEYLQIGRDLVLRSGAEVFAIDTTNLSRREVLAEAQRILGAL
jgi:broad-specificity NMP kinase